MHTYPEITETREIRFSHLRDCTDDSWFLLVAQYGRSHPGMEEFEFP